MAGGISGWNSKEGRTCREKKSTIEDVASRRSGKRFYSDSDCVWDLMDQDFF